MRILSLIDDLVVRDGLKSIIDRKFGSISVDYVYSYNERHVEQDDFKPISVQKEYKNIIKNYDLVFSLCSQIFPKELVDSVRCINFHFGLLPYACGLFTIPFSIIKHIPIGVTIHLMDEKIDHGNIIFQEQIEIETTDKCKDIEKKCQKKLIDILDIHLCDIINNNYSQYKQLEEKRKIFFKKDFDDLKRIDLEEKLTFKEFINRLRALELNDGSKAYYISEKGETISISVNLKKIR